MLEIQLNCYANYSVFNKNYGNISPTCLINMNIWLLQTGESIPIEAGGRVLRTAILADKLVERGHNVLWWANAFDHLRKQWVFNKDTDFKIKERFNVKALKGISYKKNISLSRFFSLRIIARKFQRLAPKMPRPDIIITAIPSYDLSFEAVCYARKNNIPIIVDIRDQWPDNFIDIVPQKLQTAARFFLKKEFLMLKRLLTMADALLSMTGPLLEWGLTYAGRERTWKDKIFYLGYSKGGSVNNNHTNKIYNLKNVLIGKFVVTFVGTFGKYHNPSIMIDCAKEFLGNDIIFILAGDGGLLRELKKKASSLKNVFFPGWLNQDEITTLLNYSHIGVCPTGRLTGKAFFPNKAFMYLSHGLPILSSFKGEIDEIIDKFKVGYNYGSLESLVTAIKKLRDDSKLYREMSLNALMLFNDKFDADKIYVDYAEHIESLFEK